MSNIDKCILEILVLNFQAINDDDAFHREENDMATTTGNRCVVYEGPGTVKVENIDYPKLELPPGVPGLNRKAEHGVILKIVSTNICGSDQHMVRGRTTAPKGQTLGHEITGEIIEAGVDVVHA